MLPAELRSVGVLVGQTEVVANVIDASYSGFGFQIAKPIGEFTLGTSLIIYPARTIKALYGTIVYAKSIDASTSRVGIKLKEVGQYESYRLELTNLLALTSQA